MTESKSYGIEKIKMRILKNILKVVFGNMSAIISGIFVGFVLPKIISVNDYGFYKIFTLYFSYIGVLSMGVIDGIVLKYGKFNYDELDRMMSKFPKLKVTFAHFNFITGHVDMAAEFLDKWENVYYDLTPNQFMFLDFQKKPDEWKDFFIKYQDRIIYGTDIGANTKDLDGTEADSLVHMVRGFFEETNPYSELGYDFIPIPLGDSILKKFYKENMMKFYEGKSPKSPVSSVMEEELKEVMKMRILLNVDEAADLELIKTVF